MAARGYYLARIGVEAFIAKILSGTNAGSVTAQVHRTWYRELVAPSAAAGPLRAQVLAGYRGHQVCIRNAAHAPPPVEAVRDMMPALFELLEAEPEACLRALLGHFQLVFTHPDPDGNGRIGRFLMNAMMASGGCPWTVIELARRNDYMATLDAASSRGNIVPFAEFVSSSMHRDAELATATSSPARPRAVRRQIRP